MFLFQPLPAAGSPDRSGTLSQTLGAITCSSSASVAISASLSATLGALTSSTAATVAAPTQDGDTMLASLAYPGIISPLRFARNGQVPDANFIRQLINAQNHVMAYRRKTFAVYSNFDASTAYSGYTGNTTVYRFRCHAGIGATHMRFVVALGLDQHASAVDPYVKFDVKIAGGATTSETLRGGLSSAGATDAPSEVQWREATVAVTANTTYEVTVTAVDYGRMLSMCAYELASPVVDGTVDHYIEIGSSVGYPVYDSTREKMLRGLSEIWRRNGPQLLSWAAVRTAPTYTGTTWTNVIDGATTVSASTPGFYLGTGDPTLELLARLSDNKTVDVVLAVYGAATGNNGEVRLQNSGGTICSITGITSTSQWHTTTTTIGSLDTLTKADLQARVSATISTLTLEAVSVYAYLA